MTTEVKTQEKQAPATQEASKETTSLQQIRIRPEADVYRSKEAVRILMDMPGAREQDLEVDIHNDVLSIVARVERGEQEMRVYERSFRLDRHMDTQAVEATLQRGVLTLHVPFREEAQPKRIAVKTA